MKNIILMLTATFLFQSSTLLFGQQNAPLHTEHHHSQVELFSAEMMNFVRMILEEPTLFFTEEGQPLSMESFMDGANMFNVEIVIEMESADESSPVILREASIMHQANTATWIKLDTTSWNPNIANTPKATTTALGDWQFKVGAGEGGYY